MSMSEMPVRAPLASISAFSPSTDTTFDGTARHMGLS
jgi:hypothetical protein